MRRELIDHYVDELAFLREAGAEFARANPRQAAMLAPDALQVADPFVERLLEGVAFLSARVQQKLGAQFPRFTQAMLETAYPLAAAPVPSMAVVRFEPRAGEATPVAVPRGSVLRSAPVGRFGTRCTFRTAHDVMVWPVTLVDCRYYARDLGLLGLGEGALGGGDARVRSALRLRIRTVNDSPIRELPMGALTLHLVGEGIRMRLLEKLAASSGTVIVQEPGARGPLPRWREVVREPVRPLGFTHDEALLQADARTFAGHRLVAEYFAFPERFLFVQLTGLGRALARCEGPEVELIVPFDAADPWLESRVTRDNVELGCTPAINLFEADCDRILVDGRRNDLPVVPDRLRPGDLEVWRVEEVVGHRRGADAPVRFRPFYAARAAEGAERTPFFDVSREPGAAGSSVPRSTYRGTDVKVAIVDARDAPYPDDLAQLAVRAWCTNRDLPLLLHPGAHGASDFTSDAGIATGPIACLSGPTAPRTVDFGGARNWQLVNHLTVNYLSLADGDGAALRQMLRLYAGTNPVTIQQVEALRGVRVEACTRRVRAPGPVVYARGLSLRLTIEEAAFEGGTSFLLGAVLERFFGTYVSINSFVETVLCGHERGELMRWPPRSGTRPLI